MSNKIQFLSGTLSGVIVPALTWFIYDYLLKAPLIMDKPGVPYLLAIACNLLLLRYLVRHDKQPAANGLILSTFVIAIAIFKFKL
jgi:hypothetical protein